MHHIVKRLYENRMKQYKISESLEGHEFIETETFKNSWKSLKLTDDDLEVLQNTILKFHPDSVDSIGGSAYKIRFSPPSLNRGKSSSHRVIYVDIVKCSRIYLVLAFPKSRQENLTKEQEKQIKEIAKKLEGEC